MKIRQRWDETRKSLHDLSKSIRDSFTERRMDRKLALYCNSSEGFRKARVKQGDPKYSLITEKINVAVNECSAKTGETPESIKATRPALVKAENMAIPVDQTARTKMIFWRYVGLSAAAVVLSIQSGCLVGIFHTTVHIFTFWPK